VLLQAEPYEFAATDVGGSQAIAAGSLIARRADRQGAIELVWRAYG